MQGTPFPRRLAAIWFADITEYSAHAAEDETGALFETGNVHALAETLERFARLPDTRVADMGKAGRRWVEQDFNPTTYRNRLLALYASLELVTV